MQETHVITPSLEINNELKTRTFRWQCQHCDYYAVVIVNDENQGGIFTILDDGNILIRHRCLNHLKLKSTIENYNNCAWITNT